MYKTCIKCNNEKPRTGEFFHKSGEHLHSICKECRKRNARLTYQSNRDVRLSQCKDYYRNNSEQCKINRKAYRFLANVGSGVRKCDVLRIRQYKNPFHYVGLTTKEIKPYFETLFTKGMSWDNYGNPNGDHSDCWHIDHIIPLSKFQFYTLRGKQLEDALHEAWHYSNLRPLWGLQNISRGNRL